MKLPATLLLAAALLPGFQKPAGPLLNQIQVIGSHNSYKQAIDPKLFGQLQKSDSATMSKLDYEHPALSAQLDKGLRALEIDVYADAAGGKYAHPNGLDWAPGQPAYDAAGEMRRPGFKVLHVPEIDFRSNCPTFAGCLRELKAWSAAHPGHEPVFITMNAKDEPVKRPGFAVPEPFTAATFDALDQEILAGLGADKLIRPDQVRGPYPTLEAAVLHRHWPTLRAAQGRFIFILDEVGAKRAAYIQGHPSLKGRVLFADAEPGTPEAAIHILNNARQDQALIKSLVEKGYLIRTRADSDTQEARANDRGSLAAALASGAQIISTDYYAPSTHFRSDYVVSFPGGGYFRANPLLMN